jgi:hypothetical protein
MCEPNSQHVRIFIVNFIGIGQTKILTLTDFLREQNYTGDTKFLLTASKEDHDDLILILGTGNRIFHSRLYDWVKNNQDTSYNNCGGGDFIKIADETTAKIRFFGASHNCGPVQSEYRTPEMQALIRKAFEDQLKQEESILTPDIKWSPEAY